MSSTERRPNGIFSFYAETWFNKGEALAILGYNEDALCYFDIATLLDSSLKKAWFMKCAILRKLDRNFEALDCLDKMMKLDSNDAFGWINKGLVLKSIKRDEEAIECFGRAIEICPTFASAWYEKAAGLENIKKINEAAECFQKAAELDPTNIKYLNDKGASLQRLGKLNEALQCFEKVIEIDSTDVHGWSNLGAVLASLGMLEESLKTCEKATQIDSTFSEAWNNRGVILDRLGRYDEALECFKKSADLNSTDTFAWINMGVAQEHLKRLDEALKSYEKATELNQNDAIPWKFKNNILKELGRPNEALSSLEKSIELDPTAWDAWYNKGVDLDFLGRHDEAILCFEKAIELNSQNPKSWNNKGAVLANLGKIDEALENFKRARALDSTYIAAIRNIGICYIQLNKFKNALSSLAEASEYFSVTNDKNVTSEIEALTSFARGLSSWSKADLSGAIMNFEEAKKIFENKKFSDGNKRFAVFSKSCELISKLVYLDKLFIEMVDCESLRKLEEKSLSLSSIFEDLTNTYKKGSILPDAKRILCAKSICVKALRDSLLSKTNLKELQKARNILKRAGILGSLLAVNALENFITLLEQENAEYGGIERIPKEVEINLLKYLKMTSGLDGVLSRHIPIIGYESSPSEQEKNALNLIPNIISGNLKKTVRLCCVQLDFNLIPLKPPREFGYVLQNKLEVKKKVFLALEIAKKHNVNIICFPELSTDKEWIDEVKSQYKDMIAIFGSYYEDAYNICPVIIGGQAHFVRKISPSPVEGETSEGRGMRKGRDIIVFHTPYGRFVVFVCMDFQKIRDRVLKCADDKISNLDFVFVPERNENPRLFQKAGDFVCQEDSCPYVILVNGSNIAEKKTGGTCIIGLENKDLVQRYIDDDLRSIDAGIDYKLIEAKEGENLFIADVDISQKGVKWPVKQKIKLVGFFPLT